MLAHHLRRDAADTCGPLRSDTKVLEWERAKGVGHRLGADLAELLLVAKAPPPISVLRLRNLNLAEVAPQTGSDEGVVLVLVVCENRQGVYYAESIEIPEAPRVRQPRTRRGRDNSGS